MNVTNLNWDGMADAAPYEHDFNRLDHPYVGDTLPNGATVIAYHHEDRGFGYVLAYVLHGVSKHEYATWHYRIDPSLRADAQIVTYNGQYFGNIMSAAKSFARRIGADAE